MNWVTVTLDELIDTYVKSAEATPEQVRERLQEQANRYHPVGWMLLRCVQMDSSYAGSAVLLPFGPINTFKEVPEYAVSPRGVASDMSIVEAVYFRTPEERASDNARVAVV